MRIGSLRGPADAPRLSVAVQRTQGAGELRSLTLTPYPPTIYFVLLRRTRIRRAPPSPRGRGRPRPRHPWSPVPLARRSSGHATCPPPLSVGSKPVFAQLPLHPSAHCSARHVTVSSLQPSLCLFLCPTLRQTFNTSPAALSSPCPVPLQPLNPLPVVLPSTPPILSLHQNPSPGASNPSDCARCC